MRRPHDDVFPQAAQVVNAARNRSLSKDSGGFWKEAAEMNESVESDALVIPRSRFRQFACLTVFCFDTSIFVGKSEPVDLFFEQELGVSPSLMRTQRSICLTRSLRCVYR